MLDERREPPRCAALAANDHHFECRICFTTPAKPIGLIAQPKICLMEVNAATPFLVISRAVKRSVRSAHSVCIFIQEAFMATAPTNVRRVRAHPVHGTLSAYPAGTGAISTATRSFGCHSREPGPAAKPVMWSPVLSRLTARRWDGPCRCAADRRRSGQCGVAGDCALTADLSSSQSCRSKGHIDAKSRHFLQRRCRDRFAGRGGDLDRTDRNLPFDHRNRPCRYGARLSERACQKPCSAGRRDGSAE